MYVYMLFREDVF